MYSISDALIPYYEAIERNVRGSSYNHVDETSSRMFGVSEKALALAMGAV